MRLSTFSLLFLTVALTTLSPVISGSPLLVRRAGEDEPAIGPDGRIHGCTVPNTLAMTFDDGPYIYTTGLLDTLEKHGVKATFFVNGDNYGSILDPANREIIQRAYKAGHQIASHTWSHKDLSAIPLDQARQEMTKLDDAVNEIIGRRPVYMRPPYGATNPSSLSMLNEMGYKVVIWNIETQDTSHPNDVASSLKAYDVLDQPGSQEKGWIALQHDPQEKTSQELAEKAIIHAKERGYKFATVAECLGDQDGAYRA